VVSAAPSILSLSAAGLYTLVLGVCLFAATTAGRHRQPFAHIRTWVLIAVIFGVLALMRIGGTEEVLRTILRDELRIEGGYAARRAWQRPAVLALTVTFAGLFLWGLLQQYRAAHGRRNVALFAAFAAVGMLMFLMALRIVSLHQVDMLLYGPIKLNWIVDIGSSVSVMAAAVLYTRYVQRRP
jgi:hypothetical protein